MSEEIKKYLQDILNATNTIEEFVAGTSSFQHYQSNRLLKAAV